MNKYLSSNNIISFILGLLLVYLLYLIFLHQGGLPHRHHIVQTQTQNLMKDNERKQQENQLLKAEVKDLQEGFDAVSEMARQEHGFIQENETFYALQPNTP